MKRQRLSSKMCGKSQRLCLQRASCYEQRAGVPVLLHLHLIYYNYDYFFSFASAVGLILSPSKLPLRL